MITLSYSAINSIYTCPQNWLNRQLKLSKVDFPYFHTGKAGHQAIEGHLMNHVKVGRLNDLQVGFDPHHREYRMSSDGKWAGLPYKGDYGFMGIIDLASEDFSDILEVKISSKPWGPKKFNDLMQWRVYAFMLKQFKDADPKRAWLVNCTKDFEKLKVITLDIQDKDLKQAEDWIDGGIKIIESGNYAPPEDRMFKCKFCVYQNSCESSIYG